MDLTTEDRAVLAHVLADPDAWVANAIATVGEDAVTAKIDRYRPDYLEAIAAQGEAYKTRAELDAEKAAAEAAAASAASAAQAQAETLRQQIVDLAQGAVGKSLSALTTAERASLTAILLWKAGGVTADMKVKALAEWAK